MTLLQPQAKCDIDRIAKYLFCALQMTDAFVPYYHNQLCYTLLPTTTTQSLLSPQKVWWRWSSFSCIIPYPLTTVYVAGSRSLV